MKMGKKPSFVMLLKKRAMMEDYGPSMDSPEYEDEPGGFDRESMRIAAADIIQAIRSKNEIQLMDALETFVNCCRNEDEGY